MPGPNRNHTPSRGSEPNPRGFASTRIRVFFRQRHRMAPNSGAAQGPVCRSVFRPSGPRRGSNGCAGFVQPLPGVGALGRTGSPGCARDCSHWTPFRGLRLHRLRGCPPVRTGTRCRAADGAWNMSPFLYGVGQCGPRDAISRGLSRLVLLDGLAALCEVVIHPVVSSGGRSGHGGRPRLRDCAIVNARDAACVAESQNPRARRVPASGGGSAQAEPGVDSSPTILGGGCGACSTPFGFGSLRCA